MKRNNLHNRIIFFLVLAIFCGCQYQVDFSTIYVSTQGNDDNNGRSVDSPLYSLSEAFQRISENHETNVNQKIVLDGGTYFLDSTLIISASKYSGLQSLTIESSGNNPVIISGGRKIENKWNQVSDSLWTVTIDRAEGINQLFCEGQRLTRSRWPNHYIYADSVNVKDCFLRIKTESFPIVNKLNGIELHTTGKWHFIRQMIDHVEQHSGGVNFYTVTEIGPECSSTKVSLEDRMYFENHLAFVDSENEWFFDQSNRLLYLQTKKNPNDLVFYYPVFEELVRIEGSKGENLRNIEFRGLSFKHTRWKMGEEERKGIQGGIWGTLKNKPVYAPPAALSLRYVSAAVIDHCEFTNLGEGAIAIEAGCHDIKIEENNFSDVGSNVIQIGRRSGIVGKGHPLHHDYIDSSDAPTNCLITNNIISNCGVTDMGSIGIWLGYTNHNIISHNTVTDLPYSGITSGWRWDTVASNTHDNQIIWNHIARCMQYANDGAGIYTSGNQPNTIIGNNLVVDIKGCEMWAHGIYNDEGSGNIEVTGNVVMNVMDHDYFFHRNMWKTMNVHSNNGIEGKLELQATSKYVKYLDFKNQPDYNQSQYGANLDK